MKPLYFLASIVIIVFLTIMALQIYISADEEKLYCIPFQFISPVDVNSVYVAGDFNFWNKEEDHLEEVEENHWVGELHLPEGVYEYKFIVNGNIWNIDENSPRINSDGFGGLNSVIEVGGGLDYTANYYANYINQAQIVKLQLPFLNNPTMSKQSNSHYTYNDQIAPGYYPYRFKVQTRFSIIQTIDPNNPYYTIGEDGLYSLAILPQTKQNIIGGEDALTSFSTLNLIHPNHPMQDEEKGYLITTGDGTHLAFELQKRIQVAPYETLEFKFSALSEENQSGIVYLVNVGIVDSTSNNQILWIKEEGVAAGQGEYTLTAKLPRHYNQPYNIHNILLTINAYSDLQEFPVWIKPISLDLVDIDEDIALQNPLTEPIKHEFYYQGNAEEVFVIGDFNDWTPFSTELTKLAGQGIPVWKTSVYLDPGYHQYHFIVDGAPKIDPFNPVRPGIGPYAESTGLVSLILSGYDMRIPMEQLPKEKWEETLEITANWEENIGSTIKEGLFSLRADSLFHPWDEQAYFHAMHKLNINMVIVPIPVQLVQQGGRTVLSEKTQAALRSAQDFIIHGWGRPILSLDVSLVDSRINVNTVSRLLVQAIAQNYPLLKGNHIYFEATEEKSLALASILRTNIRPATLIYSIPKDCQSIPEVINNIDYIGLSSYSPFQTLHRDFIFSRFYFAKVAAWDDMMDQYYSLNQEGIPYIITSYDEDQSRYYENRILPNQSYGTVLNALYKAVFMSELFRQGMDYAFTSCISEDYGPTLSADGQYRYPFYQVIAMLRDHLNGRYWDIPLSQNVDYALTSYVEGVSDKIEAIPLVYAYGTQYNEKASIILINTSDQYSIPYNITIEELPQPFAYSSQTLYAESYDLNRFIKTENSLVQANHIHNLELPPISITVIKIEPLIEED